MTSVQQTQKWEVLLGTGRTTSALADIGAQLAAEPDDATALRYLSRTLLSRSQVAEAERAARSSLSTEPDNEWGLRLLSLSLGLQGKDAEAVIAAQRAIEAAPMEPQVWSAAAERLVAARYPLVPGGRSTIKRIRDAFRPLAAVGLAKHAVTLDPHDASAMVSLSTAYAGIGDRQRAIAVLGLVLRNEPDHQEAQRRLAALDRRGGRFVALAMTADLLGDEDSRAALRATSIRDYSDLAGDLPMESLRPLQLDEHGRVDDRGVTNAMADGGDADVARWTGLQIRMRMGAAGAVQGIAGLFTSGGSGGGTGAAGGIGTGMVVAALALTLSALAYPYRPGRSPSWRANAARQRRSAGSVAMVLLNLAAAAAAASTLWGWHSGLKAAASFGFFCILVLIGTILGRDKAAYRVMMPSGDVFLAAFDCVRGIALTCLAVGFGGAVLTLAGQGEASSTPIAIRLPAAAVSVIAIGAAVAVLRRRNAAVRRSALLLVRGRMKWVAIWSALMALSGLIALLADPPAVAIVTIGVFVVFLYSIFLWLGTAKYLPGMNTTDRARILARVQSR